MSAAWQPTLQCMHQSGADGCLSISAAAHGVQSCSSGSSQAAVQVGHRQQITDSSVAVQAVGAGRLDALPELFQRCFLFLSLHALPSFVTLVCMPRLYRAMGQAPEVRPAQALHWTYS